LELGAIFFTVNNNDAILYLLYEKGKIRCFYRCCSCHNNNTNGIGIKLPKVTADNLLTVLGYIGIYALSFIVIGITWLNYNTLFKYIENITAKIIWLNLAFLFVLSLVPLPTQTLCEDYYTKESHMFYGIVLTCVSIVYMLMQYVANPNIIHLSKAEIKRLNTKNWLAIILYAISVPLSMLSIYFSTAIFILMPILYFLPERKLLSDLPTRVNK